VKAEVKRRRLICPTDRAIAATQGGQGFTTGIVQSDVRFGVEHGGVHKPIHSSVQYGYEKVEDLIAVFQGKGTGKYSYARQGTPTAAALEAKLARMEHGIDAVCFATGMAAIAATLLTLLRAGDHVAASRYIFGNTASLFDTLGNYGISVSKVDMTRSDSVAKALRPETRLVFVETVANPGTQVPDIERIGELCRSRGVLLVVDNTVLSPLLFRPRYVGAGLVIHSLTKTIAGHGNAMGGVVIDTGLFDWALYPNIGEIFRDADPKTWGLRQIRKKGLRDMGGTLSSQHAHLISVGAETLALRLARTSATALTLAQFLASHRAVARVHYPMLPSHPQHSLAKKLFTAGSWLMSFELRDASTCLAFIDRLKLAIKATGMGDNRTLIIPVAQTIFWEAGAAVRSEMDISDGLVRVSVGLEDSVDLIADFSQALS
jgi:O-acetylhomoserine (thiol)-lyase